jgi:hypothetical protein
MCQKGQRSDDLEWRLGYDALRLGFDIGAGCQRNILYPAISGFLWLFMALFQMIGWAILFKE